MAGIDKVCRMRKTATAVKNPLYIYIDKVLRVIQGAAEWLPYFKG